MKSAIHYLNMALRKLGHQFSEEEDREDSLFLNE
jgi:hypothetical protein